MSTTAWRCNDSAHPKEIVIVPQRDGETPKWVLIFFWEKTHFEKQHGNRRGFCGKKLQQLQTQEIVEYFACEPKKPDKSSEISHFSNFSSIFRFLFEFFHFSTFLVFS